MKRIPMNRYKVVSSEAELSITLQQMLLDRDYVARLTAIHDRVLTEPEERIDDLGAAANHLARDGDCAGHVIAAPTESVQG
jgi:hypothetical protein